VLTHRRPSLQSASDSHSSKASLVATPTQPTQGGERSGSRRWMTPSPHRQSPRRSSIGVSPPQRDEAVLPASSAAVAPHAAAPYPRLASSAARQASSGPIRKRSAGTGAEAARA